MSLAANPSTDRRRAPRPASPLTGSLRLPTALAGLLAAGLAALPLEAAQPAAGNSAPQARAVVRQAYELSQRAESIDEFSEVLRLCDEARQLPLSADLAAYVGQLAAWAHNERGERRAAQAARAADDGRADEADELDRQALDDFQRALDLEPEHWKARHNRAVSFALAGRYDEALDEFSRVVAQEPGYANAWYNRAEIHYDQDRFEEAVADYSQAIRLRPDDAGAYASRGHALFQLQQFRQALADYSRAVELEPASGEAHANRGDAYQSLGLWEPAARDYRQAIRLDDQLARAYQSAAWLMATCPDPALQHPALALEAAERAIELAGDPLDYRYLDTLAAAQAAAGQFDGARQSLAAALRAAPPEAAESLRQRQALFEAGQPYRQAQP